MSALLTLWSKEPARIIGVVTAVLALLVAFGVEISTQQQTAILGIVTAVIFVLGAEITRSQVYSPNTVAGIRSAKKRTSADT